MLMCSLASPDDYFVQAAGTGGCLSASFGLQPVLQPRMLTSAPRVPLVPDWACHIVQGNRQGDDGDHGRPRRRQRRDHCLRLWRLRRPRRAAGCGGPVLPEPSWSPVRHRSPPLRCIHVVHLPSSKQALLRQISTAQTVYHGQFPSAPDKRGVNILLPSPHLPPCNRVHSCFAVG